MRFEGFVSGCLLSLLVVSGLVSVGSFLVVDVWGWSNGGYSADPAFPDYGTHDWIAEHALDWLPVEEKQYILDNLAVYLYGTELPDNSGAPDGIGDSTLHHIYFDSFEFVMDDAAAVRASTEYNDTLTYLRADDYANAAKNAGIMVHYISDMAVFGHVMGAGTPWGAEVHHSDYEEYVNDRASAYVAEFNSFLSFDGSLDAISAYEAAKKVAYDTTFDLDGSITCVWMDQNYDWSNPLFMNRAGESLNLAVNYVTDVLHTLYLEATMPVEYYLQVPYHFQYTDYYCGPAALQMVFDYYGPTIPQAEIADVARTDLFGGTTLSDMVRAAHFSNLSTSAGSIQGYTARKLGYAALEYTGMTIDQLKFTIALGYPVIVATAAGTEGHFRVAVGYSEYDITFQDSSYGMMLNMPYSLFDYLWDHSSHWALLVAPWTARLTAPSVAPIGSTFNVTATITYPSPPPFSSSLYPASQSNATLTLSSGLSLATGQIAKKIVSNGNLTAGETGSLYWTVSADTVGSHGMSVEVEGLVAGELWYPAIYSYTDRIGGYNPTSININWGETTPPATTHNYDGLWHTSDFEITLTATDDISGVAETYYRINNNQIQTVSADEQPLMAMESANSTLEYWSVDNEGNEEAHHILTGIKLDKTGPTGFIAVNDGNPYAVMENVGLFVDAVDNTSGVFGVRFSEDGVWATEGWLSFSSRSGFSLSSGDGTKTVYYQIKNNAGLISPTYSDTIILDTVDPEVSIIDPVSGYESKSSTLTVTWTGADETSGISRYEIGLDYKPLGDVSTDLAFTLTDLADGTHTFYVVATDKAGNTKQTSVAFVVNTSPLLGPGYVEEALLGAVLVLVALGIVVYVRGKRRK